MILKTRQVGDLVLRKKVQVVSKAELQSQNIQRLIDSMIETLRDNPGVGLAAPQVGESRAIIIVEDLAKYQKKVPKKVLLDQARKPIKLQVIVNPKINVINKSKRYHFEGCLSVGGYRSIVPRADKVEVTGLDRKGRSIKISAGGWYARILQHEIDHLNGIIYVDKMISPSFITEKAFSLDWSDKVEKDLQKFF